MADLIDRQAALDAIDAWRRDYPLDLQEPIDDCWNAVRELPAVQPDHNADVNKKVERTAEIAQNVQNEDLISRKWLVECIEEGWVKFDTAKDCNRMMHLVRDIAPSVQPERKKPVFKTGESVYHVSYADGTGGFEKNKWADWTCPDCGWFVGEQYIPRRHNQQKCNYCAKCGCAIDWSDADMRGEQDEHID